MPQTTGRFFDEIGKLMTDAAGAAHGMRREMETMVRSQAERVLNELDVVRREEFEAVKAMAQKAREENEALLKRVADLEQRLGTDTDWSQAAPPAGGSSDAQPGSDAPGTEQSSA